MELTNVQCTLGAIARDEGVVERFETFVRKAQLLAVRVVDLLHLHLFKAAQDDDPKAFPSMDLNLFKAAARAVCRAEYTSPAAACNAHVDACAMEAVFDKYEQMDGMPTTGVEFATLKAMRYAHYARCMDSRLVTGVVCAPELLGAFLCNLHPESNAALDIFLPPKERAAIALIVERQLLASQLEDVYLTSYAPLLLEAGDTRLASCTNMDAHLTYAGNMWVANFKTNIQEHFDAHVRRFVGASYDEARFGDNLTKDERKEAHKGLWAETHAALQGRWDDVSPDVRAELQRHLPMERMTKPVVYHLKSKTGTCNPLHLVRAAMRMQQFVASMLNRSLCVLPEPNCNTPSYVKVDTKMAALHILTDEDVSALGVSRSVLSKQISTHKKAIWARILEVDQRRFTPNAQRGLEFSGSISTDAVGVSIQLCTKGYTRGDELDSEGGNGGNEEYVDQVDRAIYEGKRIVSIDPNMRDLMYAAAPKDHAASHDEPIRDRDDLITWRFTLMQRRFETGEKKFRKVREHLRKQRLSEQDARSAEAIEKHLPARYAPSLLALGDRIVQRTRATLATLELYRRKKWRAMRITGKLLKQRCDARMVSSFGETFGRPGEVVIAFGDASNAHNPRHHRPVELGLAPEPPDPR